MKSISAEKIEVIPVIDQRILNVCDLILTNLAKNDSLEALAKKVFLSPSRLSHLFKQSQPDKIMSEGYERFMQRYKQGISIVESALFLNQ
ncbi:hypothetical protein [Histophilus somni]|uniref:hypothetical protein n=1 Tax=Histophilus somni TaxID=731 RepID=UPI00201E87F1|nr:hypothetical protein [Histophilus somni]